MHKIPALTIPRVLVPLLLASSAVIAGCSTTANDVRAADTPAHDAQGTGAGAMQLPPGWTESDMQAMMAAGTPGPMHQQLVKWAGNWTGTSTMWMAPGAPAMTSPCTAMISPEMDGHYTKCEYSGDCPGMGPFHGLGFEGYDNVAQKFVATWLDNHSTGMMNGEGSLSADGKTLTWTYTFMCPITKKPAVMSEIVRHPDNDSMTLEMRGKDPKSGQEFKMMQLELKRQSGTKVGS